MAVYQYDWQWRIQVSLPPPQKTCGSNTGIWATSASLYFSWTNNAGTDVSAVFRAMNIGDTIRFDHLSNPSIWSFFRLQTKPIEYVTGSHFNCPVELLEVHGSVADNTVYRVTFAQAVAGPDMIGSPVFISACHGYGDSTADTLYAITSDKKMWARSIRRDHGWVEISQEREPLAHPVKEPKL